MCDDDVTIANRICLILESISREKSIEIKTEVYVSLKLTAASYNNYHFEFDVNTSDGKKHFRFDVFKAYNGGPARKFEYELSEADGKWNVSLVDLYGGKIQKETYSEFDTFIETGP